MEADGFEDGFSSPSRNLDQKLSPAYTRKIVCRYGRGCTHKSDPSHRDRFWHPDIPELSSEQIRTHYICYECAESFVNLVDLQRHLSMKTAWSDTTLIGCRISCLIDQKEWHEGIVTQYHKSGKHYVEFRTMFEKRWMQMSNSAFYIIERPSSSSDIVEFKDDDLSKMEESFAFVEEITVDYAFAQSVLFKIFGGIVQETGHKTKGHLCLTEDDKDYSKSSKGSLLYGELLPRGVNKALGSKHLNAASARTLFDLGMGIGKVVIQAFLQYRNLEFVYGVELSAGRYLFAEDAALRMVSLFGTDCFSVERVPGRSITIIERPVDMEDIPRVLKMECGNMLDVSNIEAADIVMLETDIPMEFLVDMCTLLAGLKIGARTLTYLDLRKVWPLEGFPFRQVPVNRSVADRFPTSWSVQRGHHFYLWSVVSADAAAREVDRIDGFSVSDSGSFSPRGRGCDSPTPPPGSPSRLDSSRSSRSREKVQYGYDGYFLSTLAPKPQQKNNKPILNFFRRIFAIRGKDDTPAAEASVEKSLEEDTTDDKYVRSGCFPALFGRNAHSSAEIHENEKVIPIGNSKSAKKKLQIPELHSSNSG